MIIIIKRLLFGVIEMEKIESVYRGSQIVNFYSFDNIMSINDIQKIIDILIDKGISFRGFRLSNSEEQPDHFHRTFYSLNEFRSFPWSDGIYIDDLGIYCSYKNKTFDLTFDIERNIVLTFSDGKIDLEPLLLDIDSSIKKRSK